jgi:hypothetical protein
MGLRRPDLPRLHGAEQTTMRMEPAHELPMPVLCRYWRSEQKCLVAIALMTLHKETPAQQSIICYPSMRLWGDLGSFRKTSDA